MSDSEEVNSLFLLFVPLPMQEQSGQNLWYDNSQVPTAPWSQLPEMLRPAPGNLSIMFLKIYKDFHSDILQLQQRLPAGL
eukprot:s429_g2.t1